MTLTDAERRKYGAKLKRLVSPALPEEVAGSTYCQDAITSLDLLPSSTFDLVFADPPYNLTKTFNGLAFRQSTDCEYQEWLESWMSKIVRLLKPTASIYVCGDWRSSHAIQRALTKNFIVRNRITWEREKGRGAKSNWKNTSEDIWFATMSNEYVFNVEDVKIKRRVIAPYVDAAGRPKDWEEVDQQRYRVTYPSNVWTDLTVPFWSMQENTEHPTQKPEKLLAKVILASTNPGDFVLDPFLGSGTTSVVAKKLRRRYVGIESDREYCCLAEKRLALAEREGEIQGYKQGVFWERNTTADQNATRGTSKHSNRQYSLFERSKSEAVGQ